MSRSWRLIAMALAMAALGAFSASAYADGSVTFPGSPLTVSVGTLGECQSSYANVGVNYFPPFGTVGDCGFFLAFPTTPAGQPTPLQGKVYGFQGAAGPHVPLDGEGGVEYTAIEQGPVTGGGVAPDPYSEVTKFKVSATEGEHPDFALVTVTTTYVNGQPQFTSKYEVQNITGTPPAGSLDPAPAATLYFHAIVAGDLYVSNNDQGTGVFLAGPPAFIGGQNNTSGVLGGFIEASAPALPWTNYQEGYWDGPNPPQPAIPQNEGIWNAVRKSFAATPVFNDTIDPNLMDNGAGVSWDQYLTTGLPAGESASFTIINRAQVPTTLNVQPVTQNQTVGGTATIKVTAVDTAGNPYASRHLVYSISGANPSSGSVTTDAAGVATLSYVGTHPGLDTVQMFLDLAGSGTQTAQDPASSAQVTWAPAPPVPNSEYKVQSIKANSDGTITIVFVPTQSGQATVEVTVPTGTIARHEAIAARRHRVRKCTRSQVRLKGKCRPKTTLSGKISAPGVAGVPLTLTVKPSSKVTSALRKGKNVHLTATLTYRSALGGTPTVHTYSITVKGKKAKHRKHRRH